MKVINPLERAEQAKLHFKWEMTIKELFSGDAEDLCNQITLLILEFVVLHILATERIVRGKKRKKERKPFGKARTKVYRCFKEITKTMFLLDSKLQVRLARGLTDIVEEVLSSSKRERMEILDEYLGRYLRSTWRFIDQEKKSVNLDVLRHYLRAKDFKPSLATRTVKYHQKGLVREPFRAPLEVRATILRVRPSETRDPQTEECFIKSLILFKCPECQKRGHMNYVVSEYDFLWPFLYSERIIMPLPMCQEGHKYCMERALNTMDLYTQ